MTKQQTWEKRFDNQYPYGVMIEYDKKTDTWEIDVTDDIKAFIQAELQRQREEIKEWAERKMKNEAEADFALYYEEGYNTALDDLINKLEEKTE